MTEKGQKAVSYGLSDYSVIRKGGFAFVDKTQYIEKLEECGIWYAFAVRPRRFGKTLFAGMLKFYYDISEKDNFEAYFGGTYIGSRKTASANSFRVLYLDFSGLASANLAESLACRLRLAFHSFSRRYHDAASFDLADSECNDPAGLLFSFLSACADAYGKTLYVIIDEYDHLINELFSKDSSEAGRTAPFSSVVQDLYAVLKSAAGPDGAVARMFVTGVTPFPLYADASVFNIARDISNDVRFAAMFGFTEKELKDLAAQAAGSGCPGAGESELAAHIEALSGFCVFCRRSAERVVNPAAALHCLDGLAQGYAEPGELMDPAVLPSLAKIHAVLGRGRQGAENEILDRLISGRRLSFAPALSPADITSRELSDGTLLSIMHYLGWLAWQPGKTGMQVPGRAMLRQFFRCCFEDARALQGLFFSADEAETASAFLRQGDPASFVEKILEKMQEALQDSLRRQPSQQLAACDIAVAMAMALTFSPDYRAVVERRTDNPGSACLFLQPAGGEGSSSDAYLLEVKLLSAKSAGAKADIALACAAAQRKIAGCSTGAASTEDFSLKEQLEESRLKGQRLTGAACVVCGLKAVQAAVC